MQDHGMRTDEETNPLEGNLFNLNGDKWRALRRKLAPVFTSGKLRWLFGSVEECAEQLVRSIEVNTDVDLRQVMARFTTDVIGSCAFGLRVNSLQNPDSEFRRIGEKIFQFSYMRVLRTVLRFALPSLYFRLKLRSVSKEVSDFFFGLVRGTFEERERSGESRRDFLQLLLELRRKGEVRMEHKEDSEEEKEANQYFQPSSRDRLEITDELLTAQAFVFFTGGFETSSSTLSFILYLLAKHPEAQERLREEVLADGRDYDACVRMGYLDAVISETLRLYPPAQFLMRVCTKSLVLVEGLEIEKGTSLVIPVQAIHRDPHNYPDPDLFRPERFLEGEPPKGAFLPFGDGPRICIARRFALMEIKLAVVKILANFRLEPSRKTVEPLKLMPRGLFLALPEGGLWAKFTPLRSQ